MMTCFKGGLVDLYLNTRRVYHTVYMFSLSLLRNCLKICVIDVFVNDVAKVKDCAVPTVSYIHDGTAQG